MDLSITQVPTWLSVVFIISFTTIPIFLISRAVRSAYKEGRVEYDRAVGRNIILFYFSYLSLVGLISMSGFFAVNVLPPRIIILAAIPLFLFYILYLQRRKWFQFVFEHIKLEQLISIHLFRFVGIFFFLVYHYGALPKTFAFIGGAGDIISAVLLIPLVFALKKSLPMAKFFTWIWNIIGLIDIASVLVSAILLTQIASRSNESGVEQFATFPFSWIPAFAPATIIFLHILIFKKLTQRKGNSA